MFRKGYSTGTCLVNFLEDMIDFDILRLKLCCYGFLNSAGALHSMPETRTNQCSSAGLHANFLTCPQFFCRLMQAVVICLDIRQTVQVSRWKLYSLLPGHAGRMDDLSNSPWVPQQMLMYWWSHILTHTRNPNMYINISLYCIWRRTLYVTPTCQQWPLFVLNLL